MFEYISWIFTVLSISGGFFVASSKNKYRIAGFVIWLISNIGWIAYNWYYHHNSALVLFFVYSIQCVQGIYNNKKKEIK